MSTTNSGVGEWKAVFPALTAMALATAVLTCSNRLRISLDGRVVLVEIFAFICTVVFVASAQGQDNLFERAVPSIIVLILPALAVYSGNSFWSTLYYLGVGIACFVFVDEKGMPFSRLLRRAVLLYWVCGGVLLAVSGIPLFEHAPPYLTQSQVRGFLDARLLLTILVAVFYIGTAVGRVARMDRPQVPDLPPSGIEPLQPNASILASILRPISLIACVIIDLIWATGNIVWKSLAYTWVQLDRLAREAVDLIASEFLNRNDLARAVVGASAAILPLAAFHLAMHAAPSEVSYLRSQPISSAVHGSIFTVFLHAAGMGACLVVMVHFLECLLLFQTGNIMDGILDREGFQANAAQASFGSSMLLVGFAAAGLLSYFIAKQKALQVVGFERIGRYTLVMLAIVACMLIYHSAKQIQPRKRASTARAAAYAPPSVMAEPEPLAGITVSEPRPTPTSVLEESVWDPEMFSSPSPATRESDASPPPSAVSSGRGDRGAT